MSDRRFDYDQELLQCCAQSRVVLLLQLHMQLVVESSDHANREVLHVVNPVSDKGFASPIINNNDDDDDDNPAGGEESQNSASSPSCCLELFDQYSRHYGRRHTAAETFFVDHDDDGFELGNRIEAFLRSVHFVYQHNNNNSSNNNNIHTVALNRFSDLHPDEIFATPTLTATEPIHNLWGERSRLRRQLIQEESSSGPWESDLLGSTTNTDSHNGDGVTVLLSTPEQILHVAANLTIGKGSLNKLYKYHKQQKTNAQTYDLYPVTLDIPAENQWEEAPNDHSNFAATPALTPDMDGALLSIKHNKNMPEPWNHNNINNKKKTGPQDLVEDATAVVPHNQDKRFRTHLNWATEDNPDGVPIVNEPFDQVRSFTHSFVVHDTAVALPTLLLFCVAHSHGPLLLPLLGHLRIMLGFFCGRLARSECGTSRSSQGISGVHTAAPHQRR